jgi:hypothetical protein
MLDLTTFPFEAKLWLKNNGYVKGIEPKMWAAGCSGVVSFVHWVLRCVNIPVEYAWLHPENPHLNHYAGWVSRIGRFFHGDQVLHKDVAIPPTPATAYLVPEHVWLWIYSEPMAFFGSGAGPGKAGMADLDTEEFVKELTDFEVARKYLVRTLLSKFCTSGSAGVAAAMNITTGPDAEIMLTAYSEEIVAAVVSQVEAKISALGGSSEKEIIVNPDLTVDVNLPQVPNPGVRFGFTSWVGDEKPGW